MGCRSDGTAVAVGWGMDLRLRLADYERTIIQSALQDSSGCVRTAAGELGLPERTLWYRMGVLRVPRMLGLDPPAVPKRHASRHPAAHAAVARAVRAGVLRRSETCEMCGRRARTVGHHDDYARELDVRWICRRCHNDAHRTSGA